MINSAFSLAFNGSALLSNQKEMKWDRTIFQLTTNHCTSNVTSGFSGDTASLTPNPAWNEKFSGYSITGATLTGNTFTFTNSDVTVNANYETAKNVTTTTDGHGTITASPKSGFIGTQVTLTNTPNANYGFSGYSITGATLTGNKFNLTGSNVTARATFNQTGTIYYTNNNSYSITMAGATTSKTINMNVHTVPFNWATMKYNIYKMDKASWMTVHASGYSNEARRIYGQTGTYHDFDSSAGFWINNTVAPTAKSAMIRFIINRSAGLYSAFKDSTLIGNGPFIFNCMDDQYLPTTATANSVNGIGNIYWASYAQNTGGDHSMSGLTVGGFTSYNDAYNF